MDSEHPYRPPTSDVGGTPAGLSGGGAGSISQGMLEALGKTRGWVLLMGIIMVLFCGFMVIAALGMMVFGGAAGFGAGGGLALGAIYLLMALLYLLPAVHLLRFAGAIKSATADPNGPAFEQALRHQLSFWRVVGIMTLAVIGLYILIIVGAIIFGTMSQLGG